MLKPVSQSEFDTTIAPELVRLLRRSATQSISRVADTLSNLRVDMSACHGEVLSALLQCVTNADLLTEAARGIGALFSYSVSIEAKLSIIAKVSEVYPRFGQQSVDLSASCVLLHMCDTLRASDHRVCDALLACGVTVGLCKQLKLSPSEEVKCKIVEALGSMARLIIASSQPAPALVKTELVPILSDKKSSDRVKETVLLTIESCISVDKGSSEISASLLPVECIVPYLTRLVEGRQTARVSCLAAWSIALHAFAGEKKVSTLFLQCVSSDVTFAPVLGEDSPLVRRLLKSVVSSAVSKAGSLPLFGSEVETISFPGMSEKMKNRFAINFLKVIAVTSAASYQFPINAVTPEFAARLVLALYEVVVTRGVPGHMARVALKKVASLASKIKMDSDSIALLFVLSHHPFFQSSNRKPHHYLNNEIVLHALDSVRGMVLQGASLDPASCSGFRKACLSSVDTLAALGMDPTVMQHALERINGFAVEAVTEDLGIYFCSDKVVWISDKDELAWVPTESNTLKIVNTAPALKAASSSSGFTKEDMMRSTLKDQSAVRSKIAALANNNRFCLEVLSRMPLEGETPASIGVAISERMEEMLLLLRSPLTSESAKTALLRAVSVAVSPSIADTCKIIPLALSAVDESEENWVSFFESVSDISSQKMTETEFKFLLPLFREILAGDKMNPEIAISAISALARQFELPALPVLELVKSAARKCPDAFAVCIGKLLRLQAPNLEDPAAIKSFASIGITDSEKLLKEFVSALILVPKSVIATCPRLEAFLRMSADQEDEKPATSGIVSELMELLKTEEPLIQRLSSKALAKICSSPWADMSFLNQVLTQCETSLNESSKEQEQFGFALALGSVAQVPLGNDKNFLSSFLRFVVGSVMIRSDLSPAVRDQLLLAVQETVSVHGQHHAVSLLSLTEEFIGLKQEAAALCVVIILGLLTKHLAPTDETVHSVRTKLVAELLTAALPAIQVKIASVLPPLLKMSEDVSKYLETFLNTALTSLDARARYGAALGVGAAAKAQGVGILRQLEVLKKLQETLESKNSTHEARQGAISVYGGLSLALGRLFEPYVAQVLPVLLVAFSDGNMGVREASNLAASQIMANLSTHGIKLVLPSLLKGVEDLQWRTKLGSIKLLSAMLNCAPKQLATCLPKVVPALSEAATDTHSKVKEAACASLTEVAKVIGNPEIKTCAHKLIASLTDPANDLLRQEALDVLLSTSFVHSLDAASLALVIPVMLRATRERRSEIKRKGAQILGSIAVLSADPTEGLGPYMDRIIPALEDVLVDPIPDVRTTAAKALGTMARAVPEMIVAEVLPWLFQTLKQAESQVERSGAAQGLSEVLVELGPDQFVKILPEIVSNAVSPGTNSEAREGYMGLFVFLPGVMRNAFVPYIDTVFPVLVQGLSDPLQAVREVAFRASNALCAQFAATHATVLMPSLEKGLFAKDWRARQASVQLTGTTLEHLMRSARGANRDNLLESQVPLTQERRSYMLGMLYIVRSDTNQSVNQNAQSVWKNVVANTPRTLRLILPILVRLIISNLSADETRQVLAGRCLGDLVSKLGDRVLPDLMPILIENMQSEDASVRAGVCIGLSDIANAANRQLLQEYFSIMFPAIRLALCDSVLSVRTRASETISGLFKELGNTAIHNVFPQILDQLNQNIDAANGIEQLLIPLHKELLGPVVEALTVIPAHLNLIKALEKVAVVPQLELAKFASRIVTFFMDAYTEFPDDVLHASNVLFGCFNRHSSHLALIELTRGLGGGSDKESGKLREASAFLLGSCVKCVASLDVLAEYMDSLVPVLIRIALSDAYQPAMEAALHAVSELVSKITKESMIRYMDLICGTVRDVKARPGLALPKTFETLWPIYQQALMFGNPEVREAAAKGLVILIESTPNERLKPNAIKVTGPLIRVLGERYPANIRVALLKSLQVLLERLDSALKPFLPQLQTTYQKCAQDPDDSVKLLAEESQSLLAKMTAKNA